MATYYKYAERSADSQINWAEIGRNMVDTLNEEVRIREEKKAALDAASREFSQYLVNSPEGEHVGARQWALEHGENASQYMLMQDRLLKSGQMKLKDYLVSRQNLVDGTKQAFDINKKFQERYSEVMSRSKNEESQDLEAYNFEDIQGFGDFSKSQIYINPTTGALSVAMKEKQIVDGKEVYTMSKDPNKVSSLTSLAIQVMSKFDKFNVDAHTNDFIKTLGEDIQATQIMGTYSKGGAIKTVEDIRSRTDIDPETKKILYNFIDSENQMIDAAFANPYNRTSVLTNSKKFAPNGKQYTFTKDENEAKANPDKILLRVDVASGKLTPEFSKEQVEVSNEWVRNNVRAKYTRKEDIKQTPQMQTQYAPEYVYAAGREKQEVRDLGRNLAENLKFALTGDDATSAQGIKYLSGVTGLRFTKAGKNILVENPETGDKQSFDMTEGGDVTRFGKSVIGPIAKAVKISDDDVMKPFMQMAKGTRFNLNSSAQGFIPEQKVLTPLEEWSSFTTSKYNIKDYQGKQKGPIAEQFNKDFAGTGLIANAKTFGDKISIKNNKGKELVSFNITEAGFPEKLRKWVQANPPGETEQDIQSNIKKLKETGIVSGVQGGASIFNKKQ